MKQESIKQEIKPAQASATRPENSIKAGAVQATIWRNDAANGNFFSVSLERKYKDKDNGWKSSKTLRLNDLPKAALVLNKAYEYMVLHEKEE